MSEKPAQHFFRHFSSFLSLKTLFLAGCFAVFSLNTIGLTMDIIRTGRQRREKPYLFYGILFSGLQKHLSGQDFVGYYTDQDIDQNQQSALQYAQAQYALAPIVLELNNFEHDYVILNCSSPRAADQALKKNGFKAVKGNPFGVLLAKKR